MRDRQPDRLAWGQPSEPGAAGTLDAWIPDRTSDNDLWHTDGLEAVQGKLAFETKCLACHSIGGGKKLGPDLAGVTKRRNESWLTRWLKAPEKMLETDLDAKKMLKEYNNIPMPNQNLPDAEIRQYLKYFKWYDEQQASARPATVAVEPEAKHAH